MDAADILLLFVLTAAGGGALLLAARSGVLPRRTGRDAERVLVEDALKHLHDSEERRVSCTRQSTAGALGVGNDAAAALLSRLGGMGLVEVAEDRFTLTPAGRTYALRVIRVHRLWERYLADETGLPETDWHASAEEAEHRLSATEAEALAARMGDPRYDPHGDPIPTAAGELPEPRGVPLTRLAAGAAATVVHIEDEPATAYARLVASGLHPGTVVRVAATTPGEILVEAEGRRHALPVVVAANVTVSPLPEGAAVPLPAATLASLAVGAHGRVVSLSPACRGLQRRRLMDLGVVPGTVIAVEMRSPAGDPTAYGIRGATVALRDDQARLIFVERVERGEG